MIKDGKCRVFIYSEQLSHNFSNTFSASLSFHLCPWWMFACVMKSLWFDLDLVFIQSWLLCCIASSCQSKNRYLVSHSCFCIYTNTNFDFNKIDFFLLLLSFCLLGNKYFIPISFLSIKLSCYEQISTFHLECLALSLYVYLLLKKSCKSHKKKVL